MDLPLLKYDEPKASLERRERLAHSPQSGKTPRVLIFCGRELIVRHGDNPYS